LAEDQAPAPGSDGPADWPRLVLASRSPQRRSILEQLGIAFEVIVPDVEEVEQGPADEVALQNARRKAEVVAAGHPDALILGADTVVCLEATVYGKPETDQEAAAMLRALSGRTHEVVGGLCLIEAGRPRAGVCRTGVRFRQLSDELIGWYLRSAEWRERAGGYAIQGRGAALVAEIAGDYLNVVGLPVSTLLELAPGLVA
jgi:septum formation protein